eukprot:3576548-Rhodomonas_salina.1
MRGRRWGLRGPSYPQALCILHPEIEYKKPHVREPRPAKSEQRQHLPPPPTLSSLCSPLEQHPTVRGPLLPLLAAPLL